MDGSCQSGKLIIIYLILSTKFFLKALCCIFKLLHIVSYQKVLLYVNFGEWHKTVNEFTLFYKSPSA